MFIKKP